MQQRTPEDDPEDFRRRRKIVRNHIYTDMEPGRKYIRLERSGNVSALLSPPVDAECWIMPTEKTCKMIRIAYRSSASEAAFRQYCRM
uniref:Uncharacterized protein n=1 Tax=Romanomermis culicivorax TaxID=13658 RepID=A0A915JG24_ROMCU